MRKSLKKLNSWVQGFLGRHFTKVATIEDTIKSVNSIKISRATLCQMAGHELPDDGHRYSQENYAKSVPDLVLIQDLDELHKTLDEITRYMPDAFRGYYQKGVNAINALCTEAQHKMITTKAKDPERVIQTFFIRAEDLRSIMEAKTLLSEAILQYHKLQKGRQIDTLVKFGESLDSIGDEDVKRAKRTSAKTPQPPFTDPRYI